MHIQALSAASTQAANFSIHIMDYATSSNGLPIKNFVNVSRDFFTASYMLYTLPGTHDTSYAVSHGEMPTESRY